MRKQHKTMIDALLDRRAKLRAHDEVALYDKQPDGARAVWFYHGNNIAWVNDSGEIVVTLCGYGTPSTRERLNALCSVVAPHVGFYQHAHEQYICYRGTDEHGNRWRMPEKIDDLTKAFVVGVKR